MSFLFIFTAVGTDLLLYIFAFKSLKQPFWRSKPFNNKFLLIAVIIVVITNLEETGTHSVNKGGELFNQKGGELLGPMARFTPSVTHSDAPITIDFTNNSERATNYEWKFGDGGTSIEVSK